MRLSEADVKRLGIVIEGHRARVTAPLRSASHSADKQLSESAVRRQLTSPQRDPQQLIFNALVTMEGLEVCWEQDNLIPGRKFRADIYLPASKVIVEMDGFKYHRSKDAFQSDRMRQNLFVEHGFHVLRFFARQVFHDIDAVVDQILRVHLHYRQDNNNELHI
jgi:very-short-patch-repair endonuclease